MTPLANASDAVTGILWFYHGVRQDKSLPVYDTTYLSICVSLNVLITLMIIARLALHSRNIRNAIGASSGVGGLYTTIITMLVESSAIYAVGYLLYIGTNVAGSYTGFIFSPLLGEIQVRTVPTLPQCTAIFGHCLTEGAGHHIVPDHFTSCKPDHPD